MITNQRMLFPEPATMIRSDQVLGGYEGAEGRTFPVDPQQGYGGLGLPVHKCTSLEEPRCRPPMLSVVRDILISGWIRRRQPRSVVPPGLSPCSGISAPTTKSSGLKNYERLASSISSTVCCTRAFVSLPSSHI